MKQESSYYNAKEKLAQFNPVLHNPPRFSAGGHMIPHKEVLGQKKENILSQSVRIPEWWAQKLPSEEEMQTRTKLLQRYKQVNIPDISYDIDGDGVVCAREYFLAKRFDSNGDDKIDSHERKLLMDALKNGFEDNFNWNLDRGGGQRGHRSLQVRGKFVNAEDFLSVQETYPEHPLSKYIPYATTKRELDAQRKESMMNALGKQREEWLRMHPAQKPIDFTLSEFLIDDPRHKTYTEKKEKEKKLARITAGLEPVGVDPKDCRKAPSFNYVSSPHVYTQKQLAEEIRRGNIAELSHFGLKKPKNGVERLADREDAVYREMHQNREGLTVKYLRDKMKKEIVEHNTKTFANTIIGMHGHELPKLAETKPEYWKLQPNYNPAPQHQSRTKLLGEQRNTAVKDPILFSDVDEFGAPPDRFKETHILPEKKAEVVLKTNEYLAPKEKEEDHYEYNIGVARKNQYAKEVAQAKRSIYEDNPLERPSLLKLEDEPMYSSFSPNHVFQGKNWTSQKSLKRSAMSTLIPSKARFPHSKFTINSHNDSLMGRFILRSSLEAEPMGDLKKVSVLGVRTGAFSPQLQENS